MARQPRIHFPNATYHVMARGIDGRPLFALERHQRLFLETLRRLKTQKHFRVFAYCLMNNHVHLVLQVSQSSLSEIMHLLLTRFARLYNMDHQRVGYVFQNRYKALLCTTDAYLLQLVRYVHLNPVAAKIVALPEQWPWSGHGELMGTHKIDLVDPDFPLSLFSSSLSEARRRYADFLVSRIGVASTTPPIPERDPHNIDLEPPSLHAKLTLGDVALDLERETGISLEALRSKARGQTSQVRRLLIERAFSNGYRVVEIAQFLGVTGSAVSRILGHKSTT